VREPSDLDRFERELLNKRVYHLFTRSKEQPEEFVEAKFRALPPELREELEPILNDLSDEGRLDHRDDLSLVNRLIYQGGFTLEEAWMLACSSDQSYERELDHRHWTRTVFKAINPPRRLSSTSALQDLRRAWRTLSESASNVTELAERLGWERRRTAHRLRLGLELGFVRRDEVKDVGSPGKRLVARWSAVPGREPSLFRDAPRVRKLLAPPYRLVRCDVCGWPFPARRRHARTCSTTCRVKRHRRHVR